MRGRATWLILAAMAAVIGMALAGCATGPSTSATPSQADLLTEAGFKLHTPTSNQSLAYIQTLPAQKVVSNKYKGKVLYLVCPQPESKQCYLGDRAAYDRYQELALQAQISEEQRRISEERWDPEALQMWMDSQGGGG